MKILALRALACALIAAGVVAVLRFNSAGVIFVAAPFGIAALYLFSLADETPEDSR